MQGVFRGEIEDRGVFADHKEARGAGREESRRLGDGGNLSCFPCNMVREHLVLLCKAISGIFCPLNGSVYFLYLKKNKSFKDCGTERMCVLVLSLYQVGTALF